MKATVSSADLGYPATARPALGVITDPEGPDPVQLEIADELAKMQGGFQAYRLGGADAQHYLLGVIGLVIAVGVWQRRGGLA